ncbi:phenylacetate--CoA ligase family protein [Bacillus weihaiensis]|uniref:Capsule biosynthesis protein CapK n=1 Tax=Bacillus weihaiensis TaxID=1547283 RepID=A0A1L3MML6_9BACI|nr:phenylacetate--CoA ligase family protein [Bacillus weihaiensis]APH03561.1 hypothetical protein A9C19_01660 [Bacillus weihaiensis]
MISKFVYLLGTQIRNKEIFNKYKFLKSSESWEIDDLKSHQYKKAKELITWAYEHSTFYRELFNEHNVTPEDLKSLEDIKLFPTITKQHLVSNNDEILIKNEFNKLFFSETSGSSGQVLTFYRNKEWDAAHRAAMFRGYSWYGVMPWDRNGYFWGYNIDRKKQKKVKFLDFLQNRFRIFSFKEEDVREFAKKLEKADYVEGYSTMIYEVAKLINKKKLNNNFNLKMVKGTSEKIYDKYQEEAKRAFGQKIISEYGAAEAGIIAFECPHGHMHITMENMIVEEIDGEAVITNLESKSFPIIRYRIGDYISIDTSTQCSCGMKHPIIKDILGRTGKSIYGHKDSYPSFVLYYMFKNIALEHDINLTYQAIQQVKGQLNINVEEKISDYERNLIEKEANKYFGDDMDYSIQDQMVRVNYKQKVRDFISEVQDEE